MNRIKQLREENKITQIQLAKKLNKTQQTVSLYENGTNEPDLDGYIIMSKLFNCSVEYIAGRSDERQYINIDNVKFANNGGLDTTGLDDDEVEELKKQVEYMRWKKKNKENKNEI